MSRYVPARHYVSFGIVALALAGFSGWLGLSWSPAYFPAAMFFLTAALLLGLATRPAISVHDAHIEIGKQIIPWQDIRKVDRTGWISPLVVKLTLFDDETVLLVYPGEVDCCKHLLRTLRQMASCAKIDGIPYRQYWGEMLGAQEARRMASPRYRVLRPEDEEEVERLYFLLKTVGHIGPSNSEPRNPSRQKSGDER
jgi:hypothetical protein